MKQYRVVVGTLFVLMAAKPLLIATTTALVLYTALKLWNNR